MVSLTKQIDEFLAPKTLRDRFVGVNAMKNFLGIDKTTAALERPFKAATKLRSKLPTRIKMKILPLTKLSTLAEDICAKT